MRYIGAKPSQAKYATGWANRQDQFEMKFAMAEGEPSTATA